MAHRRQTAAAVVLICMAMIWLGGNPSPKPAPEADSGTDMTNVESLLQDFDSVDSLTLQDPAEPVDQSGGGYQLTIPPSPGELSAESRNISQSPSSTTVAVYPDEAAASESSTGDRLSIPNTSRQAASGPTRDSGRRKGVRFTGQIQPLK